MTDGLSEAQLQVYAWATPNDGMTLDDLIAHMAEIGNTILEIDRANNRLKMMDVSQSLTSEQTSRIVQQIANGGEDHA